ncbi:MAG: OmpA family protein [Ignavibacteriales bacterium]|nr:OmpA family protein [Ignavibacteriales bacterium]
MKKKPEEVDFNFWPSLSDLTIMVMFILILFMFVLVIKNYLSFPVEEIQKNRDGLMRSIKQSLGRDSTIIDRDILIGTNHTIVFKDAFLFQSGKDLFASDKSEDFIRKVGQAIKKYVAENKISRVVVEGHTNDLPYNGSVFKNWYLSANRAIKIIEIFDKEGVREAKKEESSKPSRLLSIAGYAQYDYVTKKSELGEEDEEASKRIQIFIEYKIGKSVEEKFQ